jgi:3-oxo-5-alpha-steroid 4-dehydrogenase 1
VSSVRGRNRGGAEGAAQGARARRAGHAHLHGLGELAAGHALEVELQEDGAAVLEQGILRGGARSGAQVLQQRGAGLRNGGGRDGGGGGGVGSCAALLGRGSASGSGSGDSGGRRGHQLQLRRRQGCRGSGQRCGSSGNGALLGHSVVRFGWGRKKFRYEMVFIKLNIIIFTGAAPGPGRPHGQTRPGRWFSWKAIHPLPHCGGGSALPAMALALPLSDALTLSSLAMVAAGACACAALTRGGLTAPYGRYALQHAAQARAYGPPLPARAAWLLQECPSFLVALWLLLARPGGFPPLSSAPGLLACLFLAHYFNRSFIYPLRLVGGKPTPLGICLMALAFCLWNGAAQGAALAAAPAPPLPPLAQAPRLVCGVLLFCAGAGINLEADDILRRLRGPGETGYKIPYGGVFNWVSGGNFFGECLEWAGFALAAYQPYAVPCAHPLLRALCDTPGVGLLCHPAVAFALFTALNIGPRALQHHQNYLRLFGQAYPKDRKALIPYLL